MPDASRLHRAKAAILGALCADAACRPLHWVYDTDAIKRYVIELSPMGNPEFLPENRSPFYSVPTGQLSPYGGALLASLEGAGLASAPDAAAVAAGIEQSLIATFGADDSPWQTSYRQRKVAYDEKNKSVPADGFGSTPRVEWDAAVEGPWINSSILHFLENERAGLMPPGSRTSMESDSFMIAMPLAALQACREEQPDDDIALARVVSLVNAHELNASQLIMPTLFLLREIIRSGRTVAECLRHITSSSACPQQFCDAASTALASIQRPHSEVSDEIGSACANPASLTCGIHAALSLPIYTDAIRAIAFAGGCSCSRAIICGSFLAAAGGMSVIPDIWQEHTNCSNINFVRTLKIFEEKMLLWQH